MKVEFEDEITSVSISFECPDEESSTRPPADAILTSYSTEHGITGRLGDVLLLLIFGSLSDPSVVIDGGTRLEERPELLLSRFS